MRQCCKVVVNNSLIQRRGLLPARGARPISSARARGQAGGRCGVQGWWRVASRRCAFKAAGFVAMKRLKRKPMSRTFTAIAGLAGLIALSASAETADENPYSANSMLPACMAVLAISSGNPAAGIDPVEMGRCIGMIEGVALLANYGVFCPPAGAIIKQRIQVITAYIEARPQRMHEDFRVLAVEAMQKAWPCKN